jgi:amino acid adenylation domain-containing protein
MYSTVDLLDTRADRQGGDVVLVDDDRAVTYAQLRKRARCEAAALRRAGVARGDRVAILLPRGADALAVFFGAQLLGAVAVFVSDVLRPPQVAYMLEHSGARVAVTDDRLCTQLAGGPLRAGRVLRPGTADDDRVPAARPIGADLAALMYTSGSTGSPKGVMFTHDNLLRGAEIVAGYLRLGPADRTLSVLPWSFDYGFNQVLSAMWAGGSAVVARSAHAPDICRLLAEQRITGLAAVPPLWEILTGRLSPLLRRELPHLRYVTNSGGALRPGTLAALRRAHPHTEVYLMYGLTEAFRSTYLPPGLVDEHPTSMGRPIPGTEILVLDDDGHECPPGAVGELVHRGPTVAAGYWNDPAATARVFRPYRAAAPGSTGETVVHSGDYVRRDADGLLYYVGRRDELFKRRGMRVNPAEIEAFLLGTGLVRHAVVFAAPGEDTDPDVVAVVVPAVPGDAASALAAACRQDLPAFQRPSRVVERADLPRTGSGKIDRTAVKATVPAPEPAR